MTLCDYSYTYAIVKSNCTVISYANCIIGEATTAMHYALRTWVNCTRVQVMTQRTSVTTNSFL